MRVSFLFILGIFIFSDSLYSTTLTEQNEILFQKLKKAHSLSDGQIQQLKDVFSKSGFIGQGNPALAKHPATPEQCASMLSSKKISYENSEYEKICGAKYMSPLYDSMNQKAADSKACIDQFEYPDIPCEYPVVWVRAKEAAQICEIMGKRLCDAHEWEGACEGNLKAPDYDFSLIKNMGPNAAINAMRFAHNKKEQTLKSYAYGGKEYKKGICAASGFKTPGCAGGGWEQCGSNTFPTGYFPSCKSSFDVYDIHGNAAEHMNLPLKPEQMASVGSRQLGYTEMKGSWFIFDTYHAHEDWCRWRAPYWHGTELMSPHSHHNYHLGFRCCKTLK